MSDDLVRFVGKVAVVTGGATGIGRACALRFAREGAHVAALDILADGASAAAQEIETLGQEALAIQCDVRKANQLAAAVERIMATWGRIDVWVNNAGTYTGSPLLEVPLAQVEPLATQRSANPVEQGSERHDERGAEANDRVGRARPGERRPGLCRGKARVGDARRAQGLRAMIEARQGLEHARLLL